MGATKFQCPGEILRENKMVVASALFLIFIGFLLGSGTQLKEAVLEQATEQDPGEFVNIRATAYEIFRNNALIALRGVIPVFTLQVAIFSVGLVFGALYSVFAFQTYLVIFITFGALELFAAFLSVVAGLLFIKYVFLKVTGTSISLIDTCTSAFVLFLCAIGLLIPSAIIEAFLLYCAIFSPTNMTSVIILGSLTSAILIYLAVRGSRE